MYIRIKAAIMFVAIYLFVNVSGVYAQVKGEFKAPPLPGNKSKWATQPYHVGMPREEFVKLFPSDNKPYYYKQGNEEWIAFVKMLPDEDSKKVIVFYLKDNKLAGWSKGQIELEPEERLARTRERQKSRAVSADTIVVTNEDGGKRYLRAAQYRD